MTTVELQNSITELSTELMHKNPTAYKHLTENPKTIPMPTSESFNNELKSYRETLLKLLNR
ncbi:MAG: hypothetical protein ACXITV_05950 [Luteibaculaceae bacterium]